MIEKFIQDATKQVSQIVFHS